MKHTFTASLRAKGWTVPEAAREWGCNIRSMYLICSKPKKRHWIFLKGLKDKRAENELQKAKMED
jgi:hypothetical protein